MRQVLIYGSQVFGQVVRNLTMQLDMHFAGYIDDFSLHAPDVVGSFDTVKNHYSPQDYVIINAIGYRHLEERWRLHQKIKENGYETPALIHPKAYVDPSAAIGEGAIVMAHSVIDFRAKIGPLAVIWPGVVINHESCIESNVFVSPNATVCGRVRIGENSFVGAGAVVADHREVKAGSFIKAGSVYS